MTLESFFPSVYYIKSVHSLTYSNIYHFHVSVLIFKIRFLRFFKIILQMSPDSWCCFDSDFGFFSNWILASRNESSLSSLGASWREDHLLPKVPVSYNCYIWPSADHKEKVLKCSSLTFNTNSRLIKILIQLGNLFIMRNKENHLDTSFKASTKRIM